jgi:ornithine decarboxylase antizyme 1
LLLSFKCPLSEEKEVEWKTLLVNGTLYVDIPSSVLPEGSRDSFVSLLEFAEEKLSCKRVYVCFKRNRPDRQALMRVFMFLGFNLVPPDNKQVPQNDDIMSMVYNIE